MISILGFHTGFLTDMEFPSETNWNSIAFPYLISIAFPFSIPMRELYKALMYRNAEKKGG